MSDTKNPDPAPEPGNPHEPALSAGAAELRPADRAAASASRSAAQPRGWRRLGQVFTAGDPVLTLLVVALVVYYRATRGIFQGKASGDGFFGFLMLPGVILHHSVDLAAAAPEWAATFGRERTGLVANGCPVGPALLWLPTYLLGLGLDKLAAVPGVGAVLRLLVPALHAQPFTGREEADFFMAGLGSLVAGLLGLRLTFTLLVRKFGVAAARFGVIGAVAATPLAFYMITQPLYQHAGSFFGVALFVERWDAWRGRMSLTRWAALGALGGVAMLMRQQEGLWFLLPALDALFGLGQALRRRELLRGLAIVVGGALFLTCALAVYSPQLWLWWHYYGVLRPPQQLGHFLWWNPAILESLFSMRAGIFPWVPVLYIAVPGLLLARRRLGEGTVLRLGLVFALELWLNSSVWDYHGSWAYGPRRYTDAAVIVALGLGGAYATLGAGFLSARRQWALRGLVVAAGLLMVWNAVLMELVRSRRVKSASAGAYTASQWVGWAKAPAPVGRLLDRIGFPFMQPVGWLYALIYRMPVANAEGLLGGYLVERDWKVHSVLMNRGFDFADKQSYVVAGVRSQPGAADQGPPPTFTAGLVPVESQVRVVVPLMAREPLRLYLTGEIPGHGAQVQVTWNGTLVTSHERPPVPAATAAPAAAATPAAAANKDHAPDLTVLEIEVPESLVHSRAWFNELVLDHLPEGTRLKRLDLLPTKEWWIR